VEIFKKTHFPQNAKHQSALLAVRLAKLRQTLSLVFFFYLQKHECWGSEIGIFKGIIRGAH
jgi:hypothetical protein